MRETFTWVPWFTELARKIADGDEEYLNSRVRRVDDTLDSPLFVDDGPPEPLGFFGRLARLRLEDESVRDAALVRVGREFELEDRGLAEDVDAWDLPGNWHLALGLELPNERDRHCAWAVFRQAVENRVQANTFHEALQINGLALKTLTTTLFLVNPKAFLPLVDYPLYANLLGRRPSGADQWEAYSSAIAELRSHFPGCEFWEIELFARLQRSEDIAGKNMVVRPDRCWLVSTNLGEPDQRSDHWHDDFNPENRIWTGQAYPGLPEAAIGDVILVRCGVKEGRGIGVVLQNDYNDGWTPDGAIHVVWLNKSDAHLASEDDGVLQTRRTAFGRATGPETSLFRGPGEYQPTWEALDPEPDNGREEEDLSSPTPTTLKDPITFKVWDDFLRAWPPDRVRNMSLEEYTNSNRNDAFIYWLEFRTESLGSIRGGQASKFGIYHRGKKDPQGGGLIYDDKYAWMSKCGKTADEAFATIRSQLIQVIEAARKRDFEAVDHPVDLWPIVKWKVAFLYQGRDDPGLLAIYKEDRLAARYKEAFLDPVEMPPPSQQHAALIKHYSWLGDALDVSPWIWLDPEARPGPTQPTDRRYWLLPLSRNADTWAGCRTRGTASIGYAEYPVGDLRQYDSLEVLKERLKSMPSEEGANKSHTTRRGQTLWNFCHVMEPRDVIFFVAHLRRLVFGYGAVRSHYRYDTDREQHRHVRNVDWKSDFPDGREVGEKYLPNSIVDITEDLDLVAVLKEAVGFTETEECPDPSYAVEHPRNQILYGPPGTGKTYNTVGHALAILDGVEAREVTDDDKQRFRDFRLVAGEPGKARGQTAMVTFHQNYAYEDFVEGIRPRLAEAASDGSQHPSSARSGAAELAYELSAGIFRRICEAAGNASDKRFVLIIDEINRGNIPKVFGELITLIEPSRRLGADDETTVTLPYSGDEFGVPDNLYIIGTMNTADRSIQQIDTALRRRFTFVEMMPDANHDLIAEDVDGVNCREMLRAMNERIALLLDREHQIGHTYLLNVETMEQLSDTFRNRIFPLLQEYFYDDWRKIRAVLGDNAFVRERRLDDQGTKALAEQFGHAEDDRVYERLSFSSDEWENSEQYKKIYANPKED